MRHILISRRMVRCCRWKWVHHYLVYRINIVKPICISCIKGAPFSFPLKCDSIGHCSTSKKEFVMERVKRNPTLYNMQYVHRFFSWSTGARWPRSPTFGLQSVFPALKSLILTDSLSWNVQLAAFLQYHLNDCTPPATASKVPSSSHMSILLPATKVSTRRCKILSNFWNKYETSFHRSKQETWKLDIILKPLSETVLCLKEGYKELKDDNKLWIVQLRAL